FFSAVQREFALSGDWCPAAGSQQLRGVYPRRGHGRHPHQVVLVGGPDDDDGRAARPAHFSPLAISRPPKKRCRTNIIRAGTTDSTIAPAKFWPKSKVYSPKVRARATGATWRLESDTTSSGHR